MAPRVYPSARIRILDAAEAVILRDGLGGLSVDAVITEAESSKGGFFHHFASKEALIRALVERVSQAVEARMQQLAEADGEPRGRTLRAHIRVSAQTKRVERERLQVLMLALVAAAIENPTLVRKLRTINKRMVELAAAEGTPMGAAMVVLLAVDGYWLAEAMDTMPMTAAHKRAFHDTLLSLVAPQPGRKKS